MYNTIGLTATHFIRSLAVPCSQYIDDRHVGQLHLRPRANGMCAFSNFQLAQMAAFIACCVVISLGYFIGLKKSCLTPSTSRRFLGHICDSEKQAFLLPQDKKDKFAELRDAILCKKSVSVKTLQKFAGKTTSFALLVPAAKLYSNSMYQAISRASKTLAKLNCFLPFEMKFPIGVSLIAGKVSCLGEANLTYRFNCFRMLLILDGVGAFLALVVPKLWFEVIGMKLNEDVPSSSKRFRYCVSRWKISFIAPKMPG